MIESSKRGMDLVERIVKRLNAEIAESTPQTGPAVSPPRRAPAVRAAKENHREQGTTLNFPSQEVREAFEACQELRIRLSLSLLGLRRTNADLDDLEAHRAPIIHGPGGIIYSRFDNTIVIHLPQTTAKPEEWQVIAGLFTIYDNTPGGVNWMIDLSAVKEMPLRTLWSLTGFRTSLYEQNADLSLAWVYPKAFAAPSMDRTIEIFDLIPKAGQYFSRTLLQKQHGTKRA